MSAGVMALETAFMNYMLLTGSPDQTVSKCNGNGGMARKVKDIDGPYDSMVIAVHSNHVKEE